MRFVIAHVLLLLLIALAWLSQPASSASQKSSYDSKSNSYDDDQKGLSVPRRFGLTFASIRPIMRVLGMMGLPLLPLLFIRQLIGGAAGAGGGQGLGGGFGGGGGLGGLGGLGPLGGGGLGGLRPLGQGLRPLGGGLRPLGGLIGGGSNAGQNAGSSAGGAGGSTLFLKKRSISPQTPSQFTNFLKALVKLEKVFDRYDITVPDCQRLLLCEVHRRGLSPGVGSFAEKLIQAFGVEARLERSAFTINTKSVLKDFLKAARNGLTQKSCSSIYYRCPVSVPIPPARKGKI